MQKGRIFTGVFVVVLGASVLFSKEVDKMAKAALIDYQNDRQTAERKGSEKETPFACNMLALDAEGRRRHISVTEQMRAAVKEAQELPDGYAFRFQSEQSTILLVSEFIARERLCCPFFTFELVAEREDGPLWLRLRGREGVKDFIKAELGVK